MRTTVILVVATFVLACVALAQDSTEIKVKPDSVDVKAKPDSAEVKSQKDTTKTVKEPPIMKTESGVRYQDLTDGTGKEAKLNSHVECHYTLWFADSTGTKQKRFQSSKDGGKPFTCTLGGGLIKGWVDGMIGMKEGGVRRLIISPELGYGKGGGPIPPNQWLVFEIEFLKLLGK